MSDVVEANLGRIITAIKTDRQSLMQAAEFVRDAAVLNTPVNSGHLRDHIFVQYSENEKTRRAEVYTHVEYAYYVENGTGPKGAMSHDGISPEISPSYSLDPWWIHESQLDIGVAEKYHWAFITTSQGKFYKCYGQPAHPFMYPALHDNEDIVLDILAKGYKRAMEEAL